MPRPEKLQRVTAMSVSALLAANALVIAIGLGDDLTADDPAAEKTETVTFIVDEGGNRIAVDPSSPEGWRAIADAQEQGREVITVDAPTVTTATTKPTTTTTTRPRTTSSVAPASSAITLPDVEGLIDDTLTTVAGTVEQVTETVDGTVDQVTDVVDGTTGLDTGSTVDPVVDTVTDTVNETVGAVVDTVTQQTLPPITLPPVTVPPLPGLGG